MHSLGKSRNWNEQTINNQAYLYRLSNLKIMAIMLILQSLVSKILFEILKILLSQKNSQVVIELLKT